MINNIQQSIKLAQAGFTSTIIGTDGGIFNNGHVAIAGDLVFGLTVYTGEGWEPLSNLDEDSLGIVKKEIRKGGHFLWQKELDAIKPYVKINEPTPAPKGIFYPKTTFSKVSYASNPISAEYILSRPKDLTDLMKIINQVMISDKGSKQTVIELGHAKIVIDNSNIVKETKYVLSDRKGADILKTNDFADVLSRILQVWW